MLQWIPSLLHHRGAKSPFTMEAFRKYNQRNLKKWEYNWVCIVSLRSSHSIHLQSSVITMIMSNAECDTELFYDTFLLLMIGSNLRLDKTLENHLTHNKIPSLSLWLFQKMWTSYITCKCQLSLHRVDQVYSWEPTRSRIMSSRNVCENSQHHWGTCQRGTFCSSQEDHEL